MPELPRTASEKVLGLVIHKICKLRLMRAQIARTQNISMVRSPSLPSLSFHPDFEPQPGDGSQEGRPSDGPRVSPRDALVLKRAAAKRDRDLDAFRFWEEKVRAFDRSHAS